MDIEKFRSLVLSLQGALSAYGRFDLYDQVLLARLNQIRDNGSELLLDHESFFESLSLNSISRNEAVDICNYTLELINLEKSGEKKIEEKKLFQSAKDKLKVAGISFNKEDWDSVLNNLNSSIELALKEKLSIPTTISKIKTANIIEILIKHDAGPIEHLKEVKKHVFLDNKVKHVGYSTSKVDCINAIKSVEELFQQLDKTEITINQEIKDKIYGVL